MLKSVIGQKWPGLCLETVTL